MARFHALLSGAAELDPASEAGAEAAAPLIAALAAASRAARLASRLAAEAYSPVRSRSSASRAPAVGPAAPISTPGGVST